MNDINSMFMLTDLQNAIASLPTYSDEPPKWYIHRKYYKMIMRAQYKQAKATRKAKARKKRINARCGRS